MSDRIITTASDEKEIQLQAINLDESVTFQTVILGHRISALDIKDEPITNFSRAGLASYFTTHVEGHISQFRPAGMSTDKWSTLMQQLKNNL